MNASPPSALLTYKNCFGDVISNQVYHQCQNENAQDLVKINQYFAKTKTSNEKIERIKSAIFTSRFKAMEASETTVVPLYLTLENANQKWDYLYEGQIFYFNTNEGFKPVAHGWGKAVCLQTNESLSGNWYLNTYNNDIRKLVSLFHNPLSGLLKRNNVIYEGAFTNVFSNTGKGVVYVLQNNNYHPSESCEWKDGQVLKSLEWSAQEGAK